MIEIKNLSKTYHKKNILNNINLKIEEGSLTLLTGENGSGKSTLLKIIGGLIYPNNKKSIKCDYISSFLTEKFMLPRNLKVKYYINFLQKLYFIKLDYYIEYLNIPIDKKIKELSKGNLQKLGLLYVIASNNKVILLDEPTEGMDRELKKKFISVISKLHKDGHTIVISTHDKADYSRMNPTILKVEEGNTSEIVKNN